MINFFPYRIKFQNPNLFFDHLGIIRFSLEKMEAYDLIMTKDEIETLNGLACVLKPFEELTKIVQGVEYPTINLVPLLLTHIEDQLETIRILSSNVFVKEAIDILLQNLYKRIEITDEIMAAAFLDPSIQHLPIIARRLNEKGLFVFSLFNALCILNNSDFIKNRSNESRANTKNCAIMGYKIARNPGTNDRESTSIPNCLSGRQFYNCIDLKACESESISETINTRIGTDFI